MNRYSAKLLFAFVVESSESYLTQESIITFNSRGHKSAIAKAAKLGRSMEFRCKNTDGLKVHFKYLGIKDIMELSSPEFEVWYSFKRRRKSLSQICAELPQESQLMKSI